MNITSLSRTLFTPFGGTVGEFVGRPVYSMTAAELGTLIIPNAWAAAPVALDPDAGTLIMGSPISIDPDAGTLIPNTSLAVDPDAGTLIMLAAPVPVPGPTRR